MSMSHRGYHRAVLLTLLLLLALLYLLPHEDCCQTAAGDAAGAFPASGQQEADWPGCEAMLAASHIAFESGSDRLTRQGQQLLDRLMVCLEDGRFLIVGHTDNQGDQQLNLILSRQRAESVRAYLIGRGIAAERLTTDGAGESDPIASNDTEAGRARNRRIEFILQE